MEIRLTAEEYEELERLSQWTRLSMSDLVRQLVRMEYVEASKALAAAAEPTAAPDRSIARKRAASR